MIKCFKAPTQLRNLHSIHKVKLISEVLWCFWNAVDGHLTDACNFTPVDIDCRIMCPFRFSSSTVISIPPKMLIKRRNICYSWHPGYASKVTILAFEQLFWTQWARVRAVECTRKKKIIKNCILFSANNSLSLMKYVFISILFNCPLPLKIFCSQTTVSAEMKNNL